MTTLCDAHVHIVVEAARHPMAAGRPYTPDPAPVEALAAVAAREGVERFVVVQPSFYGADKSVLLDALARLGGRGRGVAVLDPGTVSRAELDGLARAGVRGLRLNLYSPGPGEAAADLPAGFAGAAGLAARMDWHVEVLAHLPALVAAADLLVRSPAPVVVDHFGLPGGAPPSSPDGRRLLDLVRHAHVWVKLSAPYRSGPDALAVAPDRGWLGALLDAAPGRCLWGSDWPHTPPHEAQPGGGARVPYRAIDYRALLAAFRAALPSAAVAEGVLGGHAARLYGFAP